MNYQDLVFILLDSCIVVLDYLFLKRLITLEQQTEEIRNPEHKSLLEANRTISRLTEEERKLKKRIKKLELALEVKEMNDSLESTYDD